MRDVFFFLIFVVGLAGLVGFQQRRLLAGSISHRIIFYSLAALSAGMAVVYWQEWSLPFPARWIADHVSPFMEKTIKGWR